MLWPQLRRSPRRSCSLESWVKEPQEAWQIPWLCREQLGAGGGTAGHPGFPPEVTITPWFPPQKGGPRVRLAEHRPASQPHPGGAESSARARFPKAPVGVPGPHMHPPERGQLQTQQPRRNLRPARLSSTPAANAKLKFIFPTVIDLWLGCGSCEAGKLCRHRVKNARPSVHHPRAASPPRPPGSLGWAWAEGPEAP